MSVLFVFFLLLYAMQASLVILAAWDRPRKIGVEAFGFYGMIFLQVILPPVMFLFGGWFCQQ